MAQVNITFDYSEAATLRDFSNSRMHTRLLIGPFGSGKSSACVMEIIQIGREQVPGLDGVRRTRWAVVRNTYRQLEDTTMKTFFDWIPQGSCGTYKVSQHDYIIDKIPGEDGTEMQIEILFRALDRPDHVRNLLSMELTGAWFNELREIPRAIFDAMDGRVGRFPSMKDGGPTWHGIICDTNPCDTDHWIYKLFEEKLPNDPELQEKFRLWKQPSGLSPEAENKKFLRKNYYENMVIGKSPEFIKVYVHGEYGYVRDGKAVYANYSDALHCPGDQIAPVRGIPLIVSFDFGLTPAVTFSQQLANGKFHCLREICSQDMGIRRFAGDIVRPFIFANFQGLPIVVTGDPAGNRRVETDEMTAYLILKRLGLNCRPARTNNLTARFNAVDTLLMRLIEGKPAFQLDPRCTLLRKGFLGEYKFRRLKLTNDDRYIDTPDKNEYSHPHDSLQYAALLAEQGMEQVRNAFAGGYSSTYTPEPSMSAWT